MKESDTPPENQPAESPMPRLDEIVAHGNRGHHYADNNFILCKDGVSLSVIAGGGTYSQPRPTLCFHGTDPDLDAHLDKVLGGRPRSLPWEVPCDFPGPYYAVEVMFHYGEQTGDVVTADVDMVRAYIMEHGGEMELDEEIAAALEQLMGVEAMADLNQDLDTAAGDTLDDGEVDSV